MFTVYTYQSQADQKAPYASQTLTFATRKDAVKAIALMSKDKVQRHPTKAGCWNVMLIGIVGRR